MQAEFYVDEDGCHAICNSEAEALRIAQKLGAEIDTGDTMVFLEGPDACERAKAAGFTVLDSEEDEGE